MRNPITLRLPCCEEAQASLRCMKLKLYEVASGEGVEYEAMQRLYEEREMHRSQLSRHLRPGIRHASEKGNDTALATS